MKMNNVTQAQQQQQNAGELKRSHKTDFGISRERSFVKPNSHQARELQNGKRKSQILTPFKGKPTMEIYRPPNVRTDSHNGSPSKLNVHAKEFVIKPNELQPSRSSVQLGPSNFGISPLQHSKSSGNVLRHVHQHHQHQTVSAINVPTIPPHLTLPLFQSASTSNMLHPHRVHFQMLSPEVPHVVHQPVLGANLQLTTNNSTKSTKNPQSVSLKRSKSLGAADSQSLLTAKLKGMMSIKSEEPDLELFPAEIRPNLKIATEDPNQLSARVLMDLVKVIIEKVVEGIGFSDPCAKLCIKIIENEKNETFLESLINTCQQYYQERDKILRGIKAGDGTRFTAFMWFLTEMSGQLKRRQLQLKTQCDGVPPGLLLLTMLVKCCQACVQPPIKSLAETECLFFVLTSIGRDLESELPAQLDILLSSVRDGFLANAAVPAIRRTLLQLIELQASNWQLPGSSVLYYYPKMK